MQRCPWEPPVVPLPRAHRPGAKSALRWPRCVPHRPRPGREFALLEYYHHDQGAGRLPGGSAPLAPATSAPRTKGRLRAHPTLCPTYLPGHTRDRHGIEMSPWDRTRTVSYTHLRAHETDSYLVCRLL